MLAYSDLTLDDVSYYWSTSTLLFERAGKKIPCMITEIDSSSDFPITLHDMSTGKKLVSLRLSTFVASVLIHHPALGYGDYKGIPLYLSARAGRERRKGMDNNNLSVLCPINWKDAIMSRLKKLHKSAIELVDSGRTTLPRNITTEYHNLMASAAGMNQPTTREGLLYTPGDGLVRRRRGNRPVPTGKVHIKDRKILAQIISQCVNNVYPTLKQALATMRRDKDVTGVSVSRDFAILRTKDMKSKYDLAVFHKMSSVGTIDVRTEAVTYNTELSSVAQQATALAFNRVRR